MKPSECHQWGQIWNVLCYIQSDQINICCLQKAPSVCLTSGSAGVRWRFLKGAVGRTKEDRSVGCQHVATWFLRGSLRWWLGGSLRGLLVLVFLRQAGVRSRAFLRDQLGSSRWLIAAVMLWERRQLKHVVGREKDRVCILLLYRMVLW